MNSRERLRRCYFHEELDRPGVYSRTFFPADDTSYDRLKSYLALHTELKQGWNPARYIIEPYEADNYTEPHSEDYKRLITVLHTPAGDLQKSDLVGLKGQPGYTEDHFLKSREDGEKYLSLPIAEPGGEVSSFFEADKKMGENGITDVSLGINPGGHVAELFGTETFAIMSVCERHIVYKLCEHRMKVIMNIVKYLVENNVGPYFSMLGEEFIVPPIHGPVDFFDFNVKYDKPIIDLIHNSNGRIHVHCHGSIKNVFNGFIEMEVDVLHPFEAPPCGDITPKEAKQLARGKICLEGNIQIADMYEHTPDQIRTETEQLIEVTFDDNKGLIVCPSASPYVFGKGEDCFPQYKAMIDTVLQWKR
jgi:hypothetical protein